MRGGNPAAQRDEPIANLSEPLSLGMQLVRLPRPAASEARPQRWYEHGALFSLAMWRDLSNFVAQQDRQRDHPHRLRVTRRLPPKAGERRESTSK